MIYKNFSLYALGACAIGLGIVYFSIPNKYEEPKQEPIVVKQEVKVQEPVKAKKVLAPLEEQNYKILNDRIVKLTKELENYKLDKESLENEGIYAELEKLKAQNEQLLEKNEKLNNALTNNTVLINEQTKNTYEEAISKLNEELASYKSENDMLKLSLNDKESTVTSLNNLLGTLSNQRQMEEFEHDNTLRKLQKELNQAKLKTQANSKNYLELTKENEVLKQRVINLNKLESTNTALNKKYNELHFQNLDLIKENSIVKKANEDLKQSLKTDATKFELEKKDLLAKLDDSKASILKLTQINDELGAQIEKSKQVLKEKEELKNELFQSKIDFEKYKNDQAKELKTITEQNKLATEKLNAELLKVNNINVELKEKSTKLEIDSKNNALKNQDLVKRIEEKDKLIVSLNDKLAQNDNKIKDLNEANSNLKKELELTTKEKIDLTTQINNINLEFLSYKNESISSLQSNTNILNDKLLASSKAYDKLNSDYIKTKEDLAIKNTEVEKYKRQSELLEKELKEIKLTINKDSSAARIASLEVEKDKLLKELDLSNQKILESYKKENTELNAQKEINQKLLKELELASKNSLLNTNSLKLIDTYTCDDIRVGSTNVNKTCSLELDEFLSKYKENYLYEITPIVDNAGFRSLNALDSTQIDPNEVRRLTKLANIGLAKDRTISAANYIKSKIKNALITTSLEPEYSKSKKGFIIRVYK